MIQAQQPVLRQQQRLRITPQLYQAIRIMALPLTDLQLTIDQELERNPALEIVSENPTDSLDEIEERPEEELFGDSSDHGFLNLHTDVDTDKRQRFLEDALQRPETLQENLLWQLQLQPIEAESLHAAELLVHNLDDNGFLLEPPEKAVPNFNAHTLRRAQRLVQGLDPVGTCVADYRESLIVQIRHHETAPPHAKTVVEDHLEALERGRFDEIAQVLGIPVADVHEILAFVRTLDPLPGRNFQSEPTRYVVPDVIVRMQDGELVIILNDEVIPVLGVDSFFEQISSKGVAGSTAVGRDTRRFAKVNLQEARSFIRNIAARNRSLVRVTRAAVDHQREFFRSGPKHLRPLTLRDVAQEVELHEATVSRIVNGKYVQTEWGIYELRHFFTNSISGAGSGGSPYSKAGVKEIVREIIEAERPGLKRLSDSRIAAILAERDVRIARRTVAKYRGELDIESSLER